MRTRRATTGDPQHWADLQATPVDPEPAAMPRMDDLVEALVQAVARRQDRSRPGSDS